jgi:hypothetical protein
VDDLSHGRRPSGRATTSRIRAGLHVQEERKRTSFRRVCTECARSAAQQCISPILQRSIGE